jgi:hypothetical protein
MATLTERKLTIKHDAERKINIVTVTCKVNFSALELCLMKACPQSPTFKLKCELWGADGFLEATMTFFIDSRTSSTIPTLHRQLQRVQSLRIRLEMVCLMKMNLY